MEKVGRLGINPGPIKVVDAAVRDVWTRSAHRWRCEHEDGRGRCSSRDTVTRWNPVLRRSESFCAGHLPNE